MTDTPWVVQVGLSIAGGFIIGLLVGYFYGRIRNGLGDSVERLKVRTDAHDDDIDRLTADMTSVKRWLSKSDKTGEP